GEYQNTVRLNANFVIAYYHAARMYDRMTRTQETIEACQAFVDRVRDIRYEKQKQWCIGRVQQLQYMGGGAMGP
ncbi:MAG: hypothetical protein HYZ27_03500, partial [Deltaproteobacteria bacterium]|nr:hypothetical protein [Deltaproteobacteria bacterium]